MYFNGTGIWGGETLCILCGESTSQKGQSLPFTLVAGLSNGSLWFSSPALVPCLPHLLDNALFNHLPHQVKRERHYKVYTTISAFNSRQSSRCALLYCGETLKPRLGLISYSSVMVLSIDNARVRMPP